MIYSRTTFRRSWPSPMVGRCRPMRMTRLHWWRAASLSGHASCDKYSCTMFCNAQSIYEYTLACLCWVLSPSSRWTSDYESWWKISPLADEQMLSPEGLGWASEKCNQWPRLQRRSQPSVVLMAAGDPRR